MGGCARYGFERAVGDLNSAHPTLPPAGIDPSPRRYGSGIESAGARATARSNGLAMPASSQSALAVGSDGDQSIVVPRRVAR